MGERLVLIVGGADTGRAPMAAALLGRIVARQGLGWMVASAGVVGHDGESAEPEARSAMLALGLDISEHCARSLSDDLAASACLLLAVDSGVARVLQARYPGCAMATISRLAGRAREIPDPFRMQVGAWLQYAGEIEALIAACLPGLRTLVEGDAGDGGASASVNGDAFTHVGPDPAVATAPPALTPAPQPPPPIQPSASQHSQTGRMAAVERAGRLLSLVAELPGVVDWSAARAQLEADLTLLAQPIAAGDLARPYVALARSLLAMFAATPSADQAGILCVAIERLRCPISPDDLEAVTQDLGRMQAL